MRIKRFYHKKSENKIEEYIAKRKTINFAMLFSVVIVCIVVIPVIIASFYSFYQTDDFKHALNVGVFGGNVIELLIASLKV